MPLFERIACTVRCRGDLLNQVKPHGGRAVVTVPEYTVLQHIHGDDAVIPDAVGESISVSAAEEYDRLSRIYDIVSNLDETGMLPMRRLFPSRNQLPTKFSEIQVALKGLPKIANGEPEAAVDDPTLP